MNAPHVTLAFVFALALAFGCHSPGGGQGSTEHGTFDSLPYTLYLPPGLDSSNPAPLVVALHGCNGDARSFAQATRLDRLADVHGFAVLYPEETVSHHEDRCWRWFSPGDQERDKGEPGTIVRMIDEIGEHQRVDRARVFVLGLSSGGAMASILGACYPDVFAAIGVHSGEEYIAGLTRDEAKRVPSQGGPDPDRQGLKAARCAGQHARLIPTMVLHGLKDPLARPVNGEQVFRQFAQTNDLADDGRDNDSVATASARAWVARARGGASYRVRRIEHGGTALVQWIEVEGLGHDWSGSVASETTEGPDASLLFWRFFSAHTR